MILTGRRVGAEEGPSLGFVTDVAPHAELHGSCALVGRAGPRVLAGVGPCEQADGMRSLDIADLEESMKLGQYPAIGDLFRSPDFVEGPLAFAQKRKPEWKG